MKLRADDQAAQPQKKRKSLAPISLLSDRNRSLFFSRVPVVLCICTGPGELGLLSHLKQTAVR